MKFQIIYAVIATIITWAVTALGSATVIFFNKITKNVYSIMLSFSAGIMIAASFWSLLQPAIDIVNNSIYKTIITLFAFILGALFMIFSQNIIENFDKKIFKSTLKNKNIFMMIFSITIHNIPEGMAVGVAFGALNNKAEIMTAIILAIGIAVQNFPEGAAISIPMRTSGYSKFKSFAIGQASALVEPIFGLLGAIFVVFSKSILPYCLSFAAGCMIFVVCSELMPEAKNTSENVKLSSMFSIIGFFIMMCLDVIL